MQQQYPDTLVIEVLNKDVKTSKFVHTRDCAIARATKRKVGHNDVGVGGTNVIIANVMYEISEQGRRDIHNAYYHSYNQDFNIELRRIL